MISVKPTAPIVRIGFKASCLSIHSTLSGIATLCIIGIVLMPAASCVDPIGPPPSDGVLPPTIVLNAPMLADIKARVDAGDPELEEAVNALRVRADDIMSWPLVSVMDKQLVPPSGDPHDYVSRAPYFWPNPATEDGLPYIKRDGQLNEDNRSGTDFTARAVMDTTVITLAFAYYLTGDERYADRAVSQLRTWFIDPETRMNPNLNYAQGVPGIMDGSLWGIIDTWRWPVLVDAVRILEASASLTRNDRTALANWFGEYQTWLRTSRLGRDAHMMWNNHGSFYDAQVAALALYAGQDSIAKSVIQEARYIRIAHGIEADGRQRYELERTRPFGYSTFNLRAYMQLAQIGEHVGEDLWSFQEADGSGIRAAIDFLAAYSDGSTAWPYYDIKLERGVLIPILRWAAYAYNEPAYVDAARRIPGYDSVAAQVPRRLMDLPQLFLEH